jgi:Na+-driven multidrug efflux pump
MLTPKHRDLTHGPIARTLLVLAWPVMLSNLFQTIYNLVDTLWLGRLGKVAIAAPTIVWPLVFLMISIGAGITIAGTALIPPMPSTPSRPASHLSCPAPSSRS